MADSVPPVPPADSDPTPERVPDPHRGEPLPPAQAGVRPEAAASGVRPEQDEPGGPLPGLVVASAAEATAEVTDDPGAEALLAQMGVEDEGIESGQIMGTVAAILVSVVVLIVALIWFIYEPFKADVMGLTESQVRYEELETTTAAGLAQLTDYRTTGEGLYGLPIERAMGVVAAQYDDQPSVLPSTRAGFNTTWINVDTPTAVQTAPERSALADPTATVDGVPVAAEDEGVEATTNEAVGIDDPEDLE